MDDQIQSLPNSTGRKPLPPTFKTLLIINVVLAVAFVFSTFSFNCFALGGYPPLAVLGALCMSFTPLLGLGLILLIGVDILFIYRLWSTAGFKALLFLAVIALAAIISSPVASLGQKLAKTRFERNYQRYEHVVDLIQKSVLPINYNSIDLPSGYRDLGMLWKAHRCN